MKNEKIIKDVFGDESAMTPSDLLSKEFHRAAIGGYNTNEVDEFLERVADALEKLITQVRSLKEAAEQRRERLEEYRQMEASLRNALVSSQKFGEDVVESAKREANLLLEEARLKKAQAQLEASKVPLALSQDILLLRQQRNRLRVEMTAILETHRNLLDSLIPLETGEQPTSVFEVAAPTPVPEAAPAEPASPPPEDEATPPPLPTTVEEEPSGNGARAGESGQQELLAPTGLPATADEEPPQ